VNHTDPDGLQIAIPAPTPFPIPLPPVFIPGTPANNAFVKSVNDIINAIKDAINPPNECNDRGKDCDNIYYNIDVPTCRGIAKKRGKAAAERCYQSAADRYAACLRGQPMPPLDTWNN
jgi:hypothetical protein